jgi:hypothetical protein
LLFGKRKKKKLSHFLGGEKKKEKKKKKKIGGAESSLGQEAQVHAEVSKKTKSTKKKNPVKRCIKRKNAP